MFSLSDIQIKWSFSNIILLSFEIGLWNKKHADWYASINSCYVCIWLGMKYEPGKGATKFLNPGAVWFVDENVAAIINTCHAYYVQDLTTRVVLH